MNGFVGQRAAATDHADVALLVNLAWHDAHFAFAGRDDARAIGADQSGSAAAQRGGDAHHVQRGNALGDADDQRKLGVERFEDGVGGVGRRNENDRGIRVCLARGFGYGVEDRDLDMESPSLAGRYAGHDAGAIGDHLLGVERALAAGEALHNDACSFVNQDAHRAPPARRTIFSAPSFMPSATVNASPDSFKISRPFSTLVPSIRTTTGSLRFKSRAAATTPAARTSQRRMPPKMLMKTPFTSGSLVRILKAFFTCSALAPPPTSRKFAGEPPASLMMSMVAIARPAPLTMQPTVPSSLM